MFGGFQRGRFAKGDIGLLMLKIPSRINDVTKNLICILELLTMHRKFRTSMKRLRSKVIFSKGRNCGASLLKARSFLEALVLKYCISH